MEPNKEVFPLLLADEDYLSVARADLLVFIKFILSIKLASV
jgi:hypothetical protein